MRIRILVKKLTAVEAKDHIGEQATVCGKVAGTRYAVTTRRKPTFLDLDKPYPSQIFTVLIWGENREKFVAAEENYRDKQVCVMGKITEYRGAPEIVARSTEHQGPEVGPTEPEYRSWLRPVTIEFQQAAEARTYSARLRLIP